MVDGKKDCLKKLLQTHYFSESSVFITEGDLVFSVCRNNGQYYLNQKDSNPKGRSFRWMTYTSTVDREKHNGISITPNPLSTVFQTLRPVMIMILIIPENGDWVLKGRKKVVDTLT